VLAAVVVAAATAAELGRLTVLSGAGEPLRAEIEIVGAQPAEFGSLAARVASADEFWRAGIEPPPLARSIRVAVARRPKGAPVVTLASAEPVDEPFVSLLVQLSSRTGQSMREYPVLLEERRARPQAAPALPAIEAPAAVEGPVETATPAPTDPGGHLVKAGETLATIADRYRPAGVAPERMLVALYRANETAFLDANMNRLRIGRTLTIPDAAGIASIAHDEAKRLVAVHREAAPAPRAAADRLQLSGGPVPGPHGSAAGDDVAALQLAAKEARERIVLLEQNVAGLQKIVEVQNRQLARVRDAQLAVLGASHPGDAVASDLVPLPYRAEAGLDRALADFVGRHWAWFATALLLAFTAWVWMPLKTARLWRKKHRHREHAARRAARKTRPRRKRARRIPPPGESILVA
jgi:FimV-like protein